jgi:hypothetical protein
MREKLRNYYSADKGKGFDTNTASRTDFNKILNKFKGESEEFLEGGQNQLPQPLEYYIDVFNTAFDFIQENPDQIEVLQGKYVTFSENLLEFYNKKNKDNNTETKAFFFSDVLDKQMEITYGEDLKDVVMQDEEHKFKFVEEEKNPEEAPTKKDAEMSHVNKKVE